MKILRLTYCFLFLSITLFGESYVDDFTRFSIDPVIEGIGGAFVSNGSAYTASNYNPALLSQTNNRELFASHSNYFDGLFTVTSLSTSKKHNNNIAYGFSAIYAGGDGVPITKLVDPDDSLSSDNRPVLVGEKSHYDLIINPSASYQFDNNLSIGLTLKIFFRHLIDETAYGAGLSAGMIKDINSKTRMGFYIRNLTTLPVVWSTGTTETALPTARLGVTREIFLSEYVDLSVSGDVEYMTSEERVIGSGGINVNIYKIFAMTMGYSDIGFSAGASAIFNNIGVSASYSNEIRLNESFRIALFYRWE